MAKQRMVQLNNLWKDRSIPVELKIMLLRCLVWPVMMYGYESWTIKKADTKKKEAAEMWFYRRLLRVKWTERRTNDSILEELSTARTIIPLINKRKLKYIGHITRNKTTQLMNTIFQGKIESPRYRGRPSATYINTLKTMSGFKLHKISQDSRDRMKWRRLVTSRCVTATIATDDADR